MKRIEFFFDYSCPYAYLASRQVEAVAARCGATLAWKPFLLGGVFRALAQPQVLPLSPAKARYLLNDQAARATELGLPLRHPTEHPRRTVSALRATLARGNDPAVIHAFYRAYWEEGRAIENDAVVHQIAGEVDLESQREVLRLNTEEAIRRGVFGAPAVFVDDELYWGEDRLWMVEAALGGAVSPPAPAVNGGRTLDFFFDFSSPFAYLASGQVDALARRTGATLRLRPMLLGAVFRAVGQVDVPLAAMSEAKRQYTLLDLGRWASHWGAPLTWPSAFPLRTVLPLRLFLLEPTVERMSRLFHAAWAEGRDIGDPAVLRGLGFTGAELQAASEQKQALVDRTGAAVDAGVFGAPSFLVDGQHLCWGQDRLGRVEGLLRGA
ncbi:MAG: DsbA family protein [Deltaproteobacteria bacterium]|nr:DsbA family protein [Deltaproteobacteria bacterium]MBM4393515.1 DsbA family protein [Deltaproteobacteria bacterium]